MAQPHQEEHGHREPERSEPEHGSAYQRERAEPRFEAPRAEAAQTSDHDRPFADPAPAPEPPVERPAPRRGSTVREPAPSSLSFSGEFSTPAPAPTLRQEPAQPEPSIAAENAAETDDSARPRRAGWWSKRLLGKG